MLNAVRKTIARYDMLTGGGVAAGVSGGADSVALLRVLLALKDEYGLTVYAVHVNHNLRGAESEADEDFVRALCGDWRVPLRVFSVDVQALAAAENLSPEEAGRRRRYAALRRAAAEWNANAIAVAHHRDDNAETVLLNLCRGAGLKGLGGIPPVNADGPDNTIKIIRPLIEQSRVAIEAYLREAHIPFRQDGSNATRDYARNRVRHDVLPLLSAQVNGGAAAVIARNTEWLREDEALLAALADDAYPRCVTENPDNNMALDIEILNTLPPALARRVIRRACGAALGGLKDVGASCAGRVMDLARGDAGREAALPHGGVARREYDRVVISRADAAPAVVESVTLAIGQPRFIPALGRHALASASPTTTLGGCTKVFCYDKVTDGLMIRARRPGDRITLQGVGTRKLQDYFTDRKIPARQRDTVPLLANGGDILWIMDEQNRVNSRYLPKEGKAAVWVTIY